MATERRSACIAHLKDTESNIKDIKLLSDTVFGNGKPGLKSRMDIMETKNDTRYNVLLGLMVGSFGTIIAMALKLFLGLR